MEVLDASALLAYLRDESGAAAVAHAIAGGTAICAVNLAEVFSRAADRGADPALLADELTRRGLLGGALAVEDFTAADAIEVARLRPLTRQAGLPLAKVRRRAPKVPDTHGGQAGARIDFVPNGRRSHRHGLCGSASRRRVR